MSVTIKRVCPHLYELKGNGQTVEVSSIEKAFAIIATWVKRKGINKVVINIIDE